MTEKELIQGCLDNSRKHQRALYDMYAAPMMGICMRYAASEAEAEDILQEGFVTIFRNIDTFKGKGALGGWIRRIVVNTALMQYRKSKKRLNDLDVNDYQESLEGAEKLFESISAKDLVAMIQQLPNGCRTVFNLYAIEGFNHREIAAELEISAGTSKSQYSRARSLLKQMIALEESRLASH